MAFYLQCNATDTDDSVGLASPITFLDGCSYEVTMEFNGVGASQSTWLLQNGDNRVFFFNGRAGMEIGGTFTVGPAGVLTPYLGVITTFIFKRTGDVYSIEVSDGTVLHSFDATGAPDFSPSLICAGFSNYIQMDLYECQFYDGTGALIHDWNKQTLNGSNDTVFPDTIGSNDATLSNFPTDNSQWVFFDDGGAGQLDIVPIGIASQESFGSVSVSLVTQFTSPTSILTQEALGSPTVAIGAVILQPPTIPSQESVEAPTVVVGGIELAVPSIGSEEALGNAIMQSGGIIVSAPSIGTEEAFGTAVVNKLLELIEVAGIASQEQFERPVVLGGDKIAIPIPDRQTWNRVAKYLRTLKFKGNDNDVICAWLRSEGYEDQYNAMWEAYLEDEGLEGSLTDKYSNWKRQ